MGIVEAEAEVGKRSELVLVGMVRIPSKALPRELQPP